MPTSQNTRGDTSNWWESLGLHYSGPLFTGRHEHAVENAVRQVLDDHPPVAFVSGTGGQTLTIGDMVELVRQASDLAESEAERQWEVAAVERCRFGWERVEEALTRADADDVVTENGWAGFTRGEATAWCWNLLHYEPHGFGLPGALVRHQAMKELEEGGIPDAFGYSERARELVARGLTPRGFREYQEALGAKPFVHTDVRHS